MLRCAFRSAAQWGAPESLRQMMAGAGQGLQGQQVLNLLAFTGTKARILTQKALPGHGDYAVAHPWHAKEVAWNQDNVQDLVNGDRARVLRVLRLLCATVCCSAVSLRTYAHVCSRML